MVVFFQLFFDLFTGALLLRYTEIAFEHRTKYPIPVYLLVSFCIIYFLAMGTRWGTGHYLKKRVGDKTNERAKRRKND